MLRFSQTRLACRRPNPERWLECLLIVVCLGLAALLHGVVGYKMVVLNLFYLPVVLAAFFLGRQRAGTLALFCVLLATVVAVWDLPSLAANTTPLIIGLSLTVWAAVMGLNAIIVGTLSDERASKLAELHDANLGVIDVLAHYLKSGDPELKQRSDRVATLSQLVARQLRLSARQVDDIRVAALLLDINHIEVTAQVVHRAFGEFGGADAAGHTFHGSELVGSLASVLSSALPLIVSQPVGREFDAETTEIPFGAAIVHAVRQFDNLVHDAQDPFPAAEAFDLMQSELQGDYHPAVLHALGEILTDLPSRAVARLEALEQLVRARP